MTRPAQPRDSLVYSSDLDAGIRRRRCGKGFVYFEPGGAPDGTPDGAPSAAAGGRAIHDAATLERIRGLAVPPAWTDVWICADDGGHLQATGRDAKGRKQYRYHTAWREFRDRVKFDRLVEFGEALPAIRRRVDADLARADGSRASVLATVTALLDLTLIRVGNEEYARANDSFGLTTLRTRHVRADGRGVRLVFRGKSGSRHDVELHDRRLVRAVRNCQELPGQLLFQYEDDDGRRHTVRSEDVNAYLRDAAGWETSAKEFRTWGATAIAAAALGRRPVPIRPSIARRVERAVMDEVADRLRNTPAVCRNSYVHPGVLEAYESGALARRWRGPAPRDPRLLHADERRLLGLLRATRRRVGRAAGERPLAEAA
jgi:DNA topoisomerase-1